MITHKFQFEFRNAVSTLHVILASNEVWMRRTDGGLAENQTVKVSLKNEVDPIQYFEECCKFFGSAGDEVEWDLD